jgi:hypothetical protein
MNNNEEEKKKKKKKVENRHSFPLEALQWHTLLSGFFILINRSIIVEFFSIKIELLLLNEP